MRWTTNDAGRLRWWWWWRDWEMSGRTCWVGRLFYTWWGGDMVRLRTWKWRGNNTRGECGGRICGCGCGSPSAEGSRKVRFNWQEATAEQQSYTRCKEKKQIPRYLGVKVDLYLLFGQSHTILVHTIHAYDPAASTPCPYSPPPPPYF